MITVPPDDLYNRELLERVHPSDWINPNPAERYDLVVIGGGTAGLVSAAGAAGLGARVALIEQHLLGGDCLNYGCVPSKALLAAARVAATVRRAPEYGVHIPDGVRVDFPAVMERMRRLRAGIGRHDSAERFRGLGVDVFLGSATFVDGGEAVQAGGARLRYRKAILCTGARAAIPPIPGLAEAGPLTNETLFSLTELPSRLAVIGGGPIGCEMAQAFARFGSAVTLFEQGLRLLPRDDPDAATIVADALRRDGVNLRLECVVREVRRGPAGVTVSFASGGQDGAAEFDRLLVAVGRAPNVAGLNLEGAGVACDRSGVRVDDYLRTTNRRVYAAGDVCSPAKFTHAADFLARVALQNSLFRGRARASRLLIPWCTYTSPEVAQVGLTPAQAAADGTPLQTFTHALTDLDRAVVDGEAEGLVKLHVLRGSDRLVGATIVGPHAGELIGEVAVAMQNGVGLKRIAATIHPYPTQAEAIRRLGDQYNRTRLTPWVRRLLRFLIRLS